MKMNSKLQPVCKKLQYDVMIADNTTEPATPRWHGGKKIGTPTQANRGLGAK
jgi:hypothetical protein